MKGGRLTMLVECCEVLRRLWCSDGRNVMRFLVVTAFMNGCQANKGSECCEVRPQIQVEG